MNVLKKRWIARTLLAAVAGLGLLGGVGAWAQHRHGGWATMSADEQAQMKSKMVEKFSSGLALDAAQKTKLGALADAMQAQHQALRGGTDPRAAVQALVAGNTFDRAGASALIDSKLAAVKLGSPAVVTAFGDFFDSLNASQQAKVRDFMAHRGGHGMLQHRD